MLNADAMGPPRPRSDAAWQPPGTAQAFERLYRTRREDPQPGATDARRTRAADSHPGRVRAHLEQAAQFRGDSAFGNLAHRLADQRGDRQRRTWAVQRTA